MCFEEFKQAVEEQYKNTSDWCELSNRADDEGKDLNEAFEENLDTFADHVYSDLVPMVEWWIQNHGCQFTSTLDEALDSQEVSADL